MTNRAPQGDMYLNWVIGTVDGFITFQCKSNGHFLDGRAEPGSTAYSTGRDPKGDAFLQWILEPAM